MAEALSSLDAGAVAAAKRTKTACCEKEANSDEVRERVRQTQLHMRSSAMQ